MLASACAPSPKDESGMESVMPPLENHADSLAMRALEASGGEMALRSLPYLRFNFRRYFTLLKN